MTQQSKIELAAHCHNFDQLLPSRPSNGHCLSFVTNWIAQRLNLVISACFFVQLDLELTMSIEYGASSVSVSELTSDGHQEKRCSESVVGSYYRASAFSRLADIPRVSSQALKFNASS